MPFGKWKGFDDCVRDFISKGKTEESAKRICGALKAGLEEKGPGPILSLQGEATSLQGEATSLQGEATSSQGRLIRGKAIHPIKIVHPEEWPSVRVYLEEELQKAAGSLIGAPLLLDHTYPLDGEVLEAKYEDGAVEYAAELNDQEVLGWIRDGTIKHCSIEYDWGSLVKVNGVAPHNITFTGLALLKDFLPGDPESSVEVWEGIIKRLKEAKKLNEQEDERERLHQAQRERAEKYGISPKEGGHLTKPAEYENIPEDQFADPVNLRYPIDKEHTRAALTYFNQADNRQAGGYSHEEQVKIMTKIIQAAIANGIEASWQPDDPVYRDLQEDLKRKLAGYEAQKMIEGLKDQISLLVKEKKASEERVQALEKEKTVLAKSLGEALIDPSAGTIQDPISRKAVAEMLEAIIPPKQIIFSHGQTGGFKRLVDDLIRVKRSIEESAT